MNKINNTIQYLVQNNLIPSTGYFSITEQLLLKYIKVYGELNGKGNTKTKSNLSLARRLAGINLLKLLLSRGFSYSKIPSGICYIISNQAYPLHYKVGMTIDLDKRLAQYQTYDPYRSFKVEAYEFVLNRREKEKEFISNSNILTENGEWILRDNALTIYHQIIKVI